MNANDAIKKFHKLALSMARSAATEHVLMSEEDLLQEAFIAILKAANQSNFPTNEEQQVKFVRSCILNLFRDLGRVASRDSCLVSMDEVTGMDDENEQITRHDLIAAPNEQGENEVKSRVQPLKIAKLTEKQRRLLQLAAEGRTTREIAAEYGVSHVAIVKALKKARGVLQVKAVA